MVCDWPGNIRQLVNEIQRIMARAEDGTLITPEHLSPELKRTSAPVSTTTRTSPPSGRRRSTGAENLSLPDAVEDLERRMIADSLRRHKATSRAPRANSGITRRGLQLKLGRYAMSATS
jgi:two-component system response regulator HupR/HoxA